METNAQLRNSELLVKKYESQYGDYMDIAKESMQKKFEYDWSAEDTLAFGRYAENWENYRPLMEADLTSRNTLGEALNSNLGLIAMAYAALPIQNLASIQPLTDEAGTVFFRNGIATQDRGQIKAGDNLIQPLGAINNQIDSYINETQVFSKTVGSATEFTIATAAELRPGSVKVIVAGGKIKGMDDGEGHILGVGIDAETSTVNYKTGEVKLKLVDAAGKGVTATDVIDVTTSQSVIDADTIPTMKWVLSSQVVRADYYILQSQYSNLSELVLRKRFGAELSDQVSADLVAQITSAIMFNAIRKLRNSAIKNEQTSGVAITWPKTAPAGIADVDHRRTFDDKLTEAVGVMYKIAGKGDVSTMVVGTSGKKILKTAGMRTIKNAVSGPHLCGMYDSVPVYYAPNSVLGDDEMLVVYRGANWYESALVYAPFLPVTTVSGNAVQNVLTNANAAYHSAALESVMDGFCVRITLV